MSSFAPELEVEMFEREGSVSFRYRSRGPDLTFEWRDFSVRLPDGGSTPCGGDDSVDRYTAEAEWEDFYVGCVMSDARPGTYVLTFRGVEVDRLTIPGV